MDPWQNDPIVTPAASPSNSNTPWQSDPIEQPPKAPDMSGVRQMVQKNLDAHDNQEVPEGSEPKPPLTPEERLNTGFGMPVTGMLAGGDRNTPVPAEVRSQYVKSLQNGSADHFGDFMQSALHAAAPIAAGVADIGGVIKSQTEKAAVHMATATPSSLVSDIAQMTVAPIVTGATRLGGAAYEKLGGELSPEWAERLTNPIPDFGQDPVLSAIREGSQNATAYQPSTFAGRVTEGAAGAIPYIAGGEASGVRRIAGIAATGLGGAGAEDIAKNLGFGEKGQQVAQILGSTPGMIYGMAPEGTWDNHPGADIIKKPVAQALEKDPAAVQSSAIDQHIADVAKDKAPPAKDFQAVNTVMGGDKLTTLHDIYEKTGIAPDQVFEDARNDPKIAADIEAEKVPEAYQHLVEEPKVEPEKLSVALSDTGKAFDVLDEDGDHVQRGFDSAEEARQWIEDKKAGPIPDEPPEWKTGAKAEAESIVHREEVGAGGLGKYSEELPIPNDQIRLYRAEPTKRGNAPDWVKQAQEDNGHKAAEGRWFTADKTHLDFYKEDIGSDHKVTYVDVPKEEANKYLVKNNPEAARFSANPENEYFLSKEIADTRRQLKDEKEVSSKIFSDFLNKFHKNEAGSGSADLYRKTIGETIKTAEKAVGKVTGDLFPKLGEAYIKTFAPELMGDKALRADAYLAKFKAKGQEAENSFYRQSAENKAFWDKKSSEERMQWLYDHETGRWNEKDNPDHARYQVLLDATFKAEKEAIGADADTGYKENYLPHSWENPDAVKAFFKSDAMIKKYGKDGFTKASVFQLIQDGVREGFKLKTDNPESMLVARLLAGHNMIATMDLLKDMEGSSAAKPVRSFSVDKRIAKIQSAIDEAQAKYDAANDKIVARTKQTVEDLQKKYETEREKANPSTQLKLWDDVPDIVTKHMSEIAAKMEKWSVSDPAVSKYMQDVKGRIDALKERLESANKEKTDNKLSPDEMKELKNNSFKIIGPDNKVWAIHNQIAPLWKNVMDMKGLYEREGVLGNAYRYYTGAKALWTQVKLGLSLFHPVHVALINVASGIASIADHLIQGGKFSDLALRDTGLTMGLSKDNLRLQDHPALRAWNTPEAERTPEQAKTVQTMLEGGFKPTLSARDTVQFKENFDKAIKGVGFNNLRLIGSAIALPGLVMKPFFEHWIPAMKSEIYLRRCEAAIARDPSLATDNGKRGEVFRQIAKDTDRTYGEMNNDVQFWNKNVRDSFNAAFISGGWKLAQIYNARGLLQPLKIAYNFAKTGEFSKQDITYNMLHAYAYTGLTLALGGAINAMLGNPVGKAKDTVWDMVKNCVFPQTGEKNPDGTPIRLNQPAFAKDAYQLAHDINTQGLLAGSGSFMYHQTLLPGIVDTLSNRDFTGKKLISDPTDLHQWTNAGWDFISPISVSTYEKAQAKHSTVGKVAGLLGFPTAGAYINQTPFEQKVISLYDEQNPPKTDVYSTHLKSELREAIFNKNTEKAEEIKKSMKEEGMTDAQIHNATKTYDKPFIESAWKRLSAEDQKRLIDSASEDEKKKFKVKGE